MPGKLENSHQPEIMTVFTFKKAENTETEGAAAWPP